MAADPVLLERVARHGLVRREATDVVSAVRVTTAIQAQDPAAGRLGVRVRSRLTTDEAVRRALDVERTVVKSSLLRGTIHLVTAEDLRWLTALVGPPVAASFAKRWTDLGLTPQFLNRTAAALPEVLAGGPATKSAVVAGLADRGIELPGQDPAPATHVLFHAALEGLVCRGPDAGREATFALVDGWLREAPVGPRGDDALAELARRYFAAYSPATAADFTAWSGLPSGRALALVRDELTPCEVHGRPGFRLGAAEPAPGVTMLPGFDNYLLGYRDRPFITDERRSEVYVGGVIRPTLLVDGAVAGRWSLDRARRAVTLVAFAGLTRRVRRAVDAEVADLSRFLDLPLDLVIG